jgi:hypothetical protein
MAQTETRPGFRLPWTADRAESGSPVAGSDSAAQEMETPEMIDAMAPSSIASPASPSQQTIGGGAMTAEQPTTTTRRPTKLMADLSRAMQVAAEQARDETMTRFDTDAKTVVEEINAASTVEAANLRRRADDDVAAVREWSKAEMARIRERTEERIGQRKTALEGEMDAHASVIKARIERVGARVATYRTEMDDFFGRLLAEQDPTRIATMAELMPEPPSLLEVAASVRAPEVTPFAPAPLPEAPAARPNPVPAAVDFAAAEAEAAPFSADLDRDPDPEADATGTPDAALTAATVHVPAAEAGTTKVTTRVVVVGLVSVASIAAFKRELGRTLGVAGIAVTSGPDGEFVFSVTHDDGFDLAGAVTRLPGFEPRITKQTADGLEVAAHDPDAG